MRRRAAAAELDRLLAADAVAVQFAVDHAANRAAKEELLNANMRLVVSIARRYQNLGVSLQDLVQEGCLGLIRAAEKYDPARGFRFATYASWYAPPPPPPPPPPTPQVGSKGVSSTVPTRHVLLRIPTRIQWLNHLYNVYY